MAGFTHLHVHSEYSLLDGLARVPDLVKSAKARGFDSLALTDHGTMYGTVQFYQAAQAAGIQPIIGCELYVAPRSRFDRNPDKDRKPYHLTVLAQDDTGYRNLLKLVSLAQLEGFYYKPRVDRESLAAHAEGLIVLSGCPSADAPRKIRAGDLRAARESLGWYKEVFGERFFVELQIHDLDFIPTLNRELVDLARTLAIPLVATNDVHYCSADDPPAHEVLLCIQTGTTMSDPKRMRIGNSFYLRTEAEMRRLFAELPEAIDNSVAIAERCRLELRFDETKLPRFEVPGGGSAADYLAGLCEAGLGERYPVLTPEIRARLDYELAVIGQMGFDDYFLIVWDLCRFARDQGIWWNVRGSGAGSIVAYTLRITNLDPLQHQLIFERFLNPSRVSMPDIDLDFPDDQRDLLIRYTFQKYGHDRVAQIITFGTMGARAAIRDAGRALAMDLADVDRVARLVPAIPGKPCGIADTLGLRVEKAQGDEGGAGAGDESGGTGEAGESGAAAEGGERGEFYVAELAALYRDDEAVRHLLDTARRLEGVARHASTHAAGVVVSDRPLVEYLPLNRPTHGGEGEGAELLPVTQFNMNDIEKLGLLKIDFLGLSTLTVLRRATELIGRYHDRHYTLDNIPLDDPAIYQLLSEGRVTGVFQVEGAGMRKMLGEMRPRRFEHVVAAIALYRPGPMDYIPSYIARMHGREPVVYRHPALEPILAETYGIIVYQEQIIQIARDLAGYNAGEADMIRKAVAKKIKEKLLAHRRQFVEGAAERGIPRAVAEGIFDDIETFARYGFNKAHAADYAVIVCQTAYLKAHYPVEYMAALLSVERNNTEKVGQVTRDCRRLGIALLPPSVDASELDFTIEPLSETDRALLEARGTPLERRRAIRFGLGAIKNVGEGPVQAILSARAPDGPFVDLDALCRRVDLRAIGKRALESLIRAGALDTFGARSQLLAALDRMLAYSGGHHAAQAAGQMSLFGDAMPQAAESSLLYPLPEAEDDPRQLLDWEKELIGLYLSEHPLQRVSDAVADAVTVLIGSINAEMSGQPVTLAGMVTSLRSTTTKKGDAMGFARVEDLQGGIEVILFPRLFTATRDLWQADRLVLVQGKVEARGDRVQVIADRAQAFDPETAVEKLDREVRAQSAFDATEAGELVPAWVAEPVEGLVAMVAAMGEAGEARPAMDAGAPGEADPAMESRGPAPSSSGLAIEDPASPAEAPATPAATPKAERKGPESRFYRLAIRLPRSEDPEQDIQLLGRLYQALRGYEGRDRFSFLVPNGADLVELDFPNDTTRYCVGLVRVIEGMIGEGRVEAAVLGG